MHGVLTSKGAFIAALILGGGFEFEVLGTYQVGQVITTNFYFVAREPFVRPDGTEVSAGSRVHIQDFAGRVVFLEWFAVWCPYCVAAAPQVRSGITDYYGERGGNPYGVPVLHVAVNQEALPFYQDRTDDFVEQEKFEIVVNDYEGSVINPVRFMFQSSGQPIFVVLNGVTNSPTHQPWEVLVNYRGYGQTDFSRTLSNFRAIIDTVQPAPIAVIPPQLTAPVQGGNGFEFKLVGPVGEYRIEFSTDLLNWTPLQTVTGTPDGFLFREMNAPLGARFYRAIKL